MYDIILQRNHIEKSSGMVAIIDIDENSLKEFGQWPWPRYRVALLLQNLKQKGAKSIGMDILFAEPDRSSPIVLQKSLKKDLGVDFSFQGLPAQLQDNDKLLAGIIEQGNFVLGFFFGEHDEEQKPLLFPPLSISVIRPPLTENSSRTGLLQARGVVPPLGVLCNDNLAAGFINAETEADGILRRTPILMEFEGNIYPNIGLATLLAALRTPSTILKLNTGGVESLRIGKNEIPLDKNGRMTLHFRGKRKKFPYYSASDILNNTIAPSLLHNKILLIGTSAAGLKDLRATPFDPYMPGVEAQATLIDNILTGDFIKNPDWLPGLELCVILFAGFFSVLLLQYTSNIITVPAISAFVLACWYSSEFAFREYHFFISPLFPIFTVAVNFSCLTFIKMFKSEHDKKFIRDAFSRYVAPALVDRITDHPELLNLEGEEKEVTILFSDIRGFTSMSEQLSPTNVTRLLNQYLTPVTRIIRENQGTLDKFIGDAVMAFWNAPLDVIHHKNLGVEAALKILTVLPELNIEFKERFGITIAVGIGIHTGTVRVGNMGSEDLFDYTILGDNVNLASRLESLTKFYGVQIIISDTLKDIAVKGFYLQEIDLVRVKGKENAVSLFTFRHEKTLQNTELELWDTALDEYKAGHFQEASKKISTIQKLAPDIHLYTVYQERCTFYLNTPPENWDGIFTHTSK